METTLRRFAGMLGHEVRFQTNSAALRDDLARVLPDRIVLDLSLGPETGVDILEWLAKHYRDVPIIFLSGQSGELLDTARRIAQGNGLIVSGTINKANLVRELPEVLGRQHIPKPRLAGTAKQSSLSLDDLQQHLLAKRIEPYFQPIFSAHRMKPVGAEVLARIRMPDGSILGPGAFIPLAEQSGLILDLTQTLCERLIELKPDIEHLGLEFLSVNLSTAKVDPERISRMIRWLVDHYLGQMRIMVELTETGLIPDIQQMRELTTQLRLCGASLAIDDFGIGYSSIRALAELPYDALKIDLSFVAEMFESEKSANLLESMLRMGHSLQLQVVAEGVETEAQRDRLIAMGVDRLQGYLLGRPVPIDQFLAQLGQRPQGTEP
jgi:EAL domain-containing protein (putative c-di-GMP-specific phosphodiesterase class I)